MLSQQAGVTNRYTGRVTEKSPNREFQVSDMVASVRMRSKLATEWTGKAVECRWCAAEE